MEKEEERKDSGERRDQGMMEEEVLWGAGGLNVRRQRMRRNERERDCVRPSFSDTFFDSTLKL